MARKLRICFIIPGFSDGGAQKQCIYLLNELQTRPDLDVHLIRFSSGVHDGLLQQQSLTIHDLPLKSNYDFRVLHGLTKVVRVINPDIIFSWLHAADVYSFFLRRLFPKTRWIMTERDSSYPNEFRYRLRHRLGRYADAIVANSEAGSDHWHRLGAKAPRHIVGNILRSVPARSTTPTSPKTVLCVGRLEPQKNVLALLRAALVLVKSRSDTEFLFIGEGSQRPAMEAIIAGAGVNGSVRLEGFQRNVDSYLTNASVLASFSRHEGLPNALMEAAAAGVPIVASAIPEHKALLGQDYRYLVTDTDEAQSSAAVIESALELGAEQHLAEARRQVATMTSAAVADAYLAIFNQVLRKP